MRIFLHISLIDKNKQEVVMVNFVHPFPDKNPGDPLTKQEIISALRLSLCAEEEATHLYDTIAEYVNDEKIKKIMKNVADEEQVHIGEFQKLLDIYEEDEMERIEEGKEEAQEKISKIIKMIKKLAQDLSDLGIKIGENLDYGQIDAQIKDILKKTYKDKEDLESLTLHTQTTRDVVPKDLIEQFNIEETDQWQKHHPEIVEKVTEEILNSFRGQEFHLKYTGDPRDPATREIRSQIKEAAPKKVHVFYAYRKPDEENYRIDVEIEFDVELT